MSVRLLPRLSAVLLLSAGCTAHYCPPPRALPVARPVEEDPFPCMDAEHHAIRQAGSTETPTRNVLVLSGGGKFGAYSAGVLTGWSARGDRPTFDVVTGISTGALIAPLVFLGPRYDALLERNYTRVSTRDIYRRRPLVSVLWSDALADSAPLESIIKRDVTPELLREIAEAHAEGRRLYVGTTNLNTRQMTVWDMGAIAASDDPGKLDLFRKVLLASAAVPGLLPPVPISVDIDGQRYVELHVDGGVTASMFLPPSALLNQDPSHVFVVVAGKLYTEPGCVKRSFVQVSGESLHGLLDSSARGDLMLLFLASRLTRNQFHLTAVPQEMSISTDSTLFDQAEMRQLYRAGHLFASSGQTWRSIPPGVGRSEWPIPRMGTRFRTEETADRPESE